MQFHLNGFRPGDPDLAEPALQIGVASRVDRLPDEVDVLIVGCGPAGLTLAAQLSAFPDISTCIVEQKPERLVLGQADGIACRTMEMFEAFGFSERVLRESYWVNETSFWKPHDERPDTIVRGGKVQDTADGTSEFPHVILNQARVHDFYLDVMQRGPTRLEPAYGRIFEGLSMAVPEPGTTATDGHPVTVRLARAGGPRAGATETVKARYVVGCDGARSGVRKALGRVLHGDSANQAWGVMDVLAVTDFPDIRLKAAIHSSSGSVLVIPREGGYLVRLYVELDKLAADERVAERDITVDRLVAVAQRILRPYTLDVKEVAWWSVYEIGQRLCDRFDDVSEADVGHRTPRVFIAGDACHTHSPKAGQGMNVSMQDGFNLGWKLAAVIRGQAVPRILDTYSAERHAIAEELIDFDRRFATMFSAPPKRAVDRDVDSDSNAVDPAEFQNYFLKQAGFTAGTATRYSSSLICADSVHRHLGSGLVIGMRFYSTPVIRLADARPMQLGHVMKADGRWRLMMFAARDDDGTTSAVRSLCTLLQDDDASPIRRFTATGADIDAVFDVRAVFQQGHRELSIDAMPALLLPRKGRYGLIDYEKVFCADVRSTDLFDLRGIDRSTGCVVVVRPDQYIAHILPLDGYGELVEFFDAFMVAANSARSS